jgi:hypothetical protein
MSTVFRIYQTFTDAGRPHPSELRVASVATFAQEFSGRDSPDLLHPSVLNNVGLSDAQLDAVAMARARHIRGSAFLVADSTGCGKGRTAMAVWLNSAALGGSKRCLYVTATHLFPDTERDTNALAAGRAPPCDGDPPPVPLTVADVRVRGLPNQAFTRTHACCACTPPTQQWSRVNRAWLSLHTQ